MKHENLFRDLLAIGNGDTKIAQRIFVDFEEFAISVQSRNSDCSDRLGSTETASAATGRTETPES